MPHIFRNENGEICGTCFAAISEDHEFLADDSAEFKAYLKADALKEKRAVREAQLKAKFLDNAIAPAKAALEAATTEAEIDAVDIG